MSVTDRLPPKPILFAMAATCFLGWLFKAHCVTNGGWLDSIQYTSGCYSDALPFWGLRGVSAGLIPYFQAPLEYPVLTGLLIWIEGGVTRILFGAGANAGHFLWVVTWVNEALAFAILWLMWRAGVDRWRLWAWAAAPPLVLYLGHNWDMLAAAMAVGAFLLARDGRPVAAAALAGLGVAAKLFPILLLPLIGLGVLVEHGERTVGERVVRAAMVAGAAIGAWGAVNLIPAWFAFTNWSEFYTFSSARSGTAASVWEIMAQFGWHVTSIPERNAQSLIAFIIGFAVIVAMGWARHRDRLWMLFAPVLAWFLLCNKVYSPQFDLWIYPLLVLSCRRWWPVALFALTDALAYFAEFWLFAGMEGHQPATTMGDVALAAGARAIVMLWIIVDIARRPAPEWISRGATTAA